MRAKASILVALLWCLALLSLAVIGVLHTARLDLLVVKNYGDSIQAHYLALAGVEKAKALLYQEAKSRSRLAAMALRLGRRYRGCESLRLDHFHAADYQQHDSTTVYRGQAGAAPAGRASFVD